MATATLRRSPKAPAAAGQVSDFHRRIAALDPEKRALFAERHPLSFAQRRLWFLDQLEPGSAEYNVPAALRFLGPFNAELLRRSLEHSVRRHAALRTVFPSFDGQPLQLALPDVAVPLPRIELRALSPAARGAEVQRLAREEARRPFDLARGPLVRASLLVCGDEEHVFFLTLHHIVSDGWSRDVLMRELSLYYEAAIEKRRLRLPKLEIQFADYARWQRDWLASDSARKELAYWRQRLAGSPPTIELPTDRSRGTGSRRTGNSWTRRFAADLSGPLQQLSREEGVSSFMIGLAVFKALLFRDSGQTDIVVGTPVVNRVHLGTEALIGIFLNLLVLRTDLGGRLTFRQLLARIRETTLEAHSHQHLPFEMLVDDLQPERNLGVHPLFQVLFTMVDRPQGPRRMAALRIEPLAMEGQVAKYDLSLLLTFENGRMLVNAEWSDALFDPSTIRRLLRRFEVFLTAALEAPDRAIEQLELLGSGERFQVLTAWNDTAASFPDATIHALFEEQAAASPEAVALICGDRQLTRGELDAQAQRLADRLVALGAGPGKLVGLCLERSPEMVVGMLAILKAGGAYLPLDPHFPAERLVFIADDAGAEILLHGAGAPSDLVSRVQLAIRLEGAVAGGEQVEASPVAVSPAGTAYVLYTSGSTGKPKGVQVAHRSVVNFLASMAREPGFEADETLLSVTTLSFDIAGLEIFLPLLCGGRLLLADRQQAADGAALRRLLESSETSVMQATPATWRMLLDAGWHGDGRLRILCGGEALPPELAAELGTAGGALWNLYGPTEATIWSTVERVGVDTRRITVGRPIANTGIYLLSRAHQLVPVGIPGRLFIGGTGLARGYLGRRALTAERFVPHPFSEQPGERLYETGDLARHLGDGRLEFLGRADNQVKIRGFRIELGEVEAVLGQHPAVAAAVAGHGPSNAVRLVAFWVPRDGERPESTQLRRFLAARLPAYMVPTLFVRLEVLPLTPNRKVDRRALAAMPLDGGSEAGRAEPRNPVEEALRGIWTELLEIEGVGIHDSFFDLGGHSLLATRVMARIRDVFGVEVPVRQMFETPTVAGLAAGVDTALRAGEGLEAPPLVRVSRQEDLPLAFAQQRMWFLEQMAPGSPAYHVHAAIRFTGTLDLAALDQSLVALTERHESLRTTFPVIGGEPVQRVSATARPGFSLTDLRGLPVARREAEARRQATRDVRRAFDLVRGPLVRISVLRLAAAEHLAVFVFHHIVSDAWSTAIFVRELVQLYHAGSRGRRPELPELAVQYPDFAAWQRGWLRGEVLEAHLAYWKERLGDPPPALELPTDRPRPSVQAFRGDYETFVLDAGLTASLRAAARRQGVTLFMLLLAGFQILLRRYTGQSDIAVGSPIANRGRLEVEGLIGVFVNMLVLRSDLSGDATARALLARVREVCLGAYAHQDLPFEKLVEELDLERSLSHTPLFQVVFALQNIPPVAEQLPDLAVQPEEIESGTAKFDLTLVMVEQGQELSGKLTYEADLFDATTVRRLVRHLENLLAGVAETPWQRLSDLPLLAASERQQLLVEWVEQRQASGSGGLLHTRIEAYAARAPEAVAVVFGDQRLRYGELDGRANRLAHHLRGRGVGPEVRVALCLERSVEMVVAIFAILKAGGAYVPLDPDSPQERLQFLLADSRAAILVTRQDLLGRLEFSHSSILCLDRDAAAIAAASDASSAGAVPGGVVPESCAYVIYTSGSTGKPKGVMVTHENMARLFDATQEWFDFGPDDVWTLFHSYAFDFSVWEIFGALAFGGRLVVVSYWLSRTPDAFYELLRKERVTVLNQTPSAFYQLVRAVEAAGDETSTALRSVVFGGEALDLEGIKPWWQRFGAARPQLVNMFGITETTVHVTYCPLTPSRVTGSGSPIGRAIPDLGVLLLDARSRAVPVAVAGELHVSGPGLARGYLARPALTAERFVPSLYAVRPGDRLYRSGDLARRLSDGELEYLGRIDHQVKIRGFRIELGEITAAVKSHPAVKDAAVLAAPGNVGGQRLVAYLVGDALPAAGELRDFLRRKLPEYMLPEAWVELDALPLTGNGKLDRRALPPPPAPSSQPDPQEGHAAARTPTEEIVATVWAQVLGLDRVGREDSFFDLGGHSLLATQAATRLAKILDTDVELRQIFEHPSVGELAKALDTARRTSLGRQVPPIEVAPRDGELPLSFAQERLWHLCQMEGGGSFYNQPAAVRLRGVLDVGALGRTLAEIGRRHEVLRTRFPAQLGQPRQEILPASELPMLPLVDLSALPDPQRRAASQRLVAEEGRRSFDLTRDLPQRLALLRLAQREHILLWTLHHVASDGWSISVLVREVAALYRAFHQGRPSPLAELPVQFADFAHWQRQWLKGEVLAELLDHWRGVLRGRSPHLELPTDRSRPRRMSRRGAQHAFHLADDLGRGFRKLAAGEGATLFMVLLAGFEALLAFESGQDEVIVGTNVAGRNRLESEDLVGCFINQLVLRTDLAGNPSFREVVGRVRNVCMEAYAHQDLPFDKLVAELRPEHDPSRPVLYQVKVELQIAPPAALALPGLTLEAVEPEQPTVRYDLHLLLGDSRQGTEGSLMYNTDLFDASTIARMVEDYQLLLRSAVEAPDTTLEELGRKLRTARRRSGERRRPRKQINVEGLRTARRQVARPLPSADSGESEK